MASCFDTLVGLSARDCPCFEDGRPAGGASAETAQVWKYQTWESGASPADPLTLTTAFKLPATFDADNVQLFENGSQQTITTDFTRTGNYTLAVSTPAANATYQLWYLADVPYIKTVPAYNHSDSGLYLSQLLPEDDLRGLVDCDRTVWDLFTEARDIAIKEFVGSVNSHILRRHNVRRKTFNGFVGTPDPEGTLTSAYTYCGVRIRTNPVGSGYLRISRIMSLFEATGVVPVTIYAGDGTVVTPTFNLNTTAGKKCFTEVNLTLPLLGDFEASQDYYIVYTFSALNKPKLNKTYCPSCNGQRAILNVSHYDTWGEWDSDYRGVLQWNNWLIAGGWQGNSVSDFSVAPDNVEPYMNGLALEIEVGCDLLNGLCGTVQGAGPESMAAATFIQRRAASILVQKRANSSVPARENTVNREQLAKTAMEWEADAAEAMAYLSQNVNETMNDCVTCKSRMRLGGILT